MATIETNWDEIPTEYRFTAVDEDGSKYAYFSKPIILKNIWCASSSPMLKHVGNVRKSLGWRESLRERPSDTTPPTIFGAVTGSTNFKELINHKLIFQDKNWNEIGRLEWANGILEFSGNATESAKVFMEELKRQFHAAIEIEIERLVKELQFNGESDE